MYKKLPEFIVEIANAHDGSLNKMMQLIQRFNKLKYQKKSIKFQIFKFDKISTKNFSWYKTYTKLFFSPKQWKIIFSKVSKGNEIWVDLFDEYSLDILKQNNSKIKGIKLQSSILKNNIIFDGLKKINLKKKKLIINISGHNLNEIKKIYKYLSSLKVKKIYFQTGFQDYPTKIKDLNVNKILLLKKTFTNIEFSFADHTDAKTSFSKVLPVILYFYGNTIIEKHFCLDRNSTKYDYFSSLEPKEMQETLDHLKNLNQMTSNEFTNKSEQNYLKNSIQKTVLERDKSKFQLINYKDLSFKRSSQTGMNIEEILNIQKKFFILKKSKRKDEVLKINDFKKSNIGIFVTCRLKSQRLKNKALLKIQGRESILRCLDNSKKIKNKNLTVLLTSYLNEDKPLIQLINNKMNNVKVFSGHPDDIVKRFISCAEKYKVDTIVRVTGDCPVISNEIIDLMIKSHFNNGADFTYADKFSVGTVGEVYSVSSLKTIAHHFPLAKYSEYLPWYFYSNESFFKINKVIINKSLIRNYRLTLDYEEDLKMFNKLFYLLKIKKLKNNIKNIFKVMDNNKSLANINKSKKLVYTQKAFSKNLYKNTKFKSIV